jgi:hypothetical protein
MKIAASIKHNGLTKSIEARVTGKTDGHIHRTHDVSRAKAKPAPLPDSRIAAEGRKDPNGGRNVTTGQRKLDQARKRDPEAFVTPVYIMGFVMGLFPF